MIRAIGRRHEDRAFGVEVGLVQGDLPGEGRAIALVFDRERWPVEKSLAGHSRRQADAGPFARP